LLCDLNGYCGNTTGWYTPDNANIGSTGLGQFCGSIENNSWVSFIAETTSASFQITSSNCASAASGIQAAIFSTNNCTNFQPISTCVSQAGGYGAFEISTTAALVPGNQYYIMLDGFAGNICDYTVVPLTGVKALTINGPPNNTVCKGQNTTLTLTGYNVGSTFDWQPAAAISGANNSPSITTNTTSSTSYKCTVTTAGACAVSDVFYTLKVDDINITASADDTICEGQNVALTSNATTSLPTISFSNNTSVNITDNNATGVNSIINVNGIPGTVGTQLESVCLNVSHTYIGDLEARLTCPNGTIINLVLRRGAAGDNFAGTCFSVAGPAISTGVAPFAGTFTPEQALALLSACNVNGNWTLNIRDRVAGDVGVLLDWTLTFTNSLTYNWSPATGLSATNSPNVTASPSGTITYNVTANDYYNCSSTESITVTVEPNITPTFSPIASLCQGEIAPALPNTSINGISGTWSLAVIDNMSSAAYTFTPNAGICANTTSLNVTVNPAQSSFFNNVLPICSGSTPPILPTTSTNGITGTWSPSVVDNLNSANYTFTPSPGQCAAPASMYITVNSNVTPVFNPIPDLCFGDIAPVLPTTSTNGISGTWSPSVVSNTTSNNYIFTPNPGQCGILSSLLVNVNSLLIPIFNPIAPICQGDPAPVLPSVSVNGISGTWTPSTVNNAASGSYTFVPTTGTCSQNFIQNVNVITSPITTTVFHD
jgi:subtilisin-like proprotein convertase family protein